VPIVVIDTNLVFTDLRLKSPWIRALIMASAQRDADIELAVPEVVVQELKTQYRRDFDEALGVARKSRRALRNLAPQLPPVDVNQYSDPAGTVDQYETWLREQIETRAQGRILSAPAVHHDVLLRRLAMDERPFRDDAGYKDALIWFSVLELALEGEQVLFCSNNHKDFFVSSGRPPLLAEELVRDLELEGLDADSVVPFRSIEEAMSHFLPSVVDPLSYALEAEDEVELAEVADEAVQLLASPESRTLVEREIGEIVYYGVNPNTVTIMSPAEATQVDPRGSPRVLDITLEDVGRDDEGRPVVDLVATVAATVNYELTATDEDDDHWIWNDLVEISLHVPIVAHVDHQNHRLVDFVADEEVEWGVAEDYQAMP
jgi:PIN domain